MRATIATWTPVAVWLAVAGALVAGPSPAAAQVGSWPTLSDLWPGYISPEGTVQFSVSGRADVEAYVPQSEPAWLIPSTAPFGTGRLRVFTDLFVGAQWYATAELRVDGGEAPEAGHVEARLEQAFVRWTAAPGFAFQAGKMVSAFGSYPLRHHTAADPLIRPPLHYEYRTMICPALVPLNATSFVGWKDEPEEFRPMGAPPIWAAPYQWGAMAFGVLGAFNYRLAVLNSAPSSEPEAWEWQLERLTETPSFVAAVGYRFAPWLRAELWHDRGPYLAEPLEGPLPAGASPADYDQILYGGEAVFELGYTAVRAEVVYDIWEVPNVPKDPVDLSYSIEATQTLRTGLYVAGRYGAIRFNEITSSGTGYDGGFNDSTDRWDYPVSRVQLGGGYRLARNAEVRAEYAWNVSHGPFEPDDDLFSVQLWWEF